MKQTYLKKILSLLLMASILLVPFTGCSKDEYGEIGEIDLDSEEAAMPETPFTKTDNPFEEYQYRTVDFDCAWMRFEIPKSWDEKIINQGCIRYDAPSDDPIFPGARFYIQCNYSYSAVKNDLDPFSHIAAEFSTNMSQFISGLPFPYGDTGDVWIKSYNVADETEYPSFTDDETAACLEVTKDVILIRKVTADAKYLNGFDMVAGYFRWNGFPVMIMTVVPNSWDEDAKALIGYMISGAEYKKPVIEAPTTFYCGDVGIQLPSDFQIRSSKLINIFYSPYEDIKATSGMCIGFFRLPEALSDLSLEYMQERYSDEVAAILTDPAEKKYYYVVTSTYEYGGEKLADEAAAYSADVNLTSNLYDYTGAERQYGCSDARYMDMFIKDVGGTNYMIAAMYSKQQEKIAAKIIKDALLSLTTK